MSLCIECGELELYYVLACGDDAVGESQILLFAGEELTELKEEIRVLDEAFGALDQAKAEEDPNAGVEAQDHLAKMLNGYILPMADLPNRHLVQAYAIHGKRWTRIRSDKMRNHWRRYPVDKSLLEAEGSGDDPKQLNRRGLRSAFRAASDKIKDDISAGITYRSQIAKGQVGGSITDLWDASWLKWVDAVNDSLVYSGSSGYHDLSAGAQLLRGYAGFGVNLGYNPEKNTYGITANGEARAILAEAKAQFDGYMPHRDGWHALIDFDDTKASQAGVQSDLDFGYFRAKLTIMCHAMLGASIYGTAGIEYSPGANNSIMAKPSMAGAKGQVSAGAFAGVEAGGSVAGALEWQNPGWREGENGPIQNAKWAAFISVGVAAAGNAGIGAEVDFYITFENGKFMFRAKAQLVVGVGAKGSLVGSINFGAIFEFLMYVYHQLADNDFKHLSYISETAFRELHKLALAAIEYGIDAVERAFDEAGEVIEDMIEQAMLPFHRADAAEDYAKKIKARPEALMFAPPETKGAVLYKLSETFTFSFEEHQEAAILTVLGTVQTKAEWSQIVERITPDGSKSSEAAGLRRLNYIMDGGSQVRFDRMMRLIQALPATREDIGAPVIMRNVA